MIVLQIISTIISVLFAFLFLGVSTTSHDKGDESTATIGIVMTVLVIFQLFVTWL